jgi:hypothetical protein
MPVARAARRALPAALLLALALPAAAQAAATITVSGPTPPRTLTFTASDGIDHQTVPLLASDGHLWIKDLDGIDVGASGCTTLTATIVDCGTASGFTRLTFSFGTGNDAFALQDGLDLPVTVDGGAGADEIEGGDEGDLLGGGDGGDTVHGNGGADMIDGGPGADEISGDLGFDVIDGGTGDDLIGASDGQADAAPITCGAGNDSVDFDVALDVVAGDCEIVPPRLDADPMIFGQPIVGATLTRSSPPSSGGIPTAAYTFWERCDVSGWPCEDIPGAESPTYTVTAADVGSRIAVVYYLANSAGWDGRESALTAIVGAAGSGPVSAPPALSPAPLARTVPVKAPDPTPFAVAGAPAVTARGATALVDTGRKVTCPAGELGCVLTATARPGGASAHVRGRPAIAGSAQIRLRAGATAKIAIRLTPKAVRLLRKKRKITLAVKAVLKRGIAEHATSSFTVTVKAPAHGRR